MKKRLLLKENFIFNQEVFEDFYAEARKKGVLAIVTEKGSAEYNMGIFYLNKIPDIKKSRYDIQRILWGLIHKYGHFRYTPKRFNESLKYFEFQEETRTWNIYNR